MITEDYVSFEIAKLLKEKGFPQEYDIYHSMIYNEGDYEREYEVQRMVLETKLVKAGTLSSYPIGVPEPKCYCPTHQMVMKWLREVYKLSIEPYSIAIEENRIGYAYAICSCKTGLEIFAERWDGKNPFVSYEEAVEVAIKYCLENLI